MEFKVILISCCIILSVINTTCLPLNRHKRAPSPCIYRENTYNCSSRELTEFPATSRRQKASLHTLILSDNRIADFSDLSRFRKLKTLDLKRNGIEDLGKVMRHLGRSVQNVDVTGNVIHHLDTDDFPPDSRLKTLIGLEVQEIGSDAPFRHLEKLEDLELTLHSATVNETLFQGPKIEKLTLTLTEAKYLPNRIFLPLAPKVETIKLSGLNLESIDHRFSTLTKLRKIYLDLPKVNILPSDLLCGSGIKVAEGLNISVIVMPHLASMLDSLSQNCLLQEVDIRNVYRIPEGFFRNITTLEIVRLRNVTVMPLDMFHHMPRLDELDLSHNWLTSIPHGWFDSLQAVTTFNMSYNQLRYLNESAFGKIQNIVYLDLSSNKLHSINAKTFHPFRTSLKMVNLSYNNFGDLPSGLFSRMLSLEHLLLVNASLRSIPNDTFYQVRSLKILEAQHNQLKKIDDNDFHGLNSLIKLDLSYNQIEDIGVTSFRHMTELREINLEGNNLFRLPLNLFHDLEQLNLKDNNYHCNCDAYHMYQTAYEFNPDLVIELVCATPTHLHGINVSELTEDVCKQTTTREPDTTTMLETTTVIDTTIQTTIEASSMTALNNMTTEMTTVPVETTKQTITTVPVETTKQTREQDTTTMFETTTVTDTTIQTTIEASSMTALNNMTTEMTTVPVETTKQTITTVPVETTRQTREPDTTTMLETTTVTDTTIQTTIEASSMTALNNMTTEMTTVPVETTKQTITTVPVETTKQTREPDTTTMFETTTVIDTTIQTTIEASSMTVLNDITTEITTEMTTVPVETTKQTIVEISLLIPLSDDSKQENTTNRDGTSVETTVEKAITTKSTTISDESTELSTLRTLRPDDMKLGSSTQATQSGDESSKTIEDGVITVESSTLSIDGILSPEDDQQTTTEIAGSTESNAIATSHSNKPRSAINATVDIDFVDDAQSGTVTAPSDTKYENDLTHISMLQPSSTGNPEQSSNPVDLIYENDSSGSITETQPDGYLTTDVTSKSDDQDLGHSLSDAGQSAAATTTQETVFANNITNDNTSLKDAFGDSMDLSGGEMNHTLTNDSFTVTVDENLIGDQQGTESSEPDETTTTKPRLVDIQTSSSYSTTDDDSIKNGNEFDMDDTKVISSTDSDATTSDGDSNSDDKDHVDFDKMTTSTESYNDKVTVGVRAEGIESTTGVNAQNGSPDYERRTVVFGILGMDIPADDDMLTTTGEGYVADETVGMHTTTESDGLQKTTDDGSGSPFSEDAVFNQNLSNVNQTTETFGHFSSVEEFIAGVVTLGDDNGTSQSILGIKKNINSNDVTKSSTSLYDVTNSPETPSSSTETTADDQSSKIANFSWLIKKFVEKLKDTNISESINSAGTDDITKDVKYDVDVQAVQMDEKGHNRLRILLWTVITILIVLNILLLIFFTKRLEGWLYKRSYVVNKSTHLY